MPEGPMRPIVAPVVPSMSSTASPFGDLLDSLMTGLPAATQPPRPGLPLVTEGLPSLSPAAEASALLPSLPTLSEHVAEVTGCPKEFCAVLAQAHSYHLAPPGHG